MIIARTPRRPSWLASINPVGPPPTISTPASIRLAQRLVAVGPEHDPRPRRVQPREVARLNPVEGLRLRIVDVRLLELRELLRRQARPQPAQVDLDAAVGEVRGEHQIGMRLP